MAESGVDQKQVPKRADSSRLRDLFPRKLKRLLSRRKTNQVHETTPVSSSQEVVVEDAPLTREQDIKSPEHANKIAIAPEKITTKMWQTENHLDEEFIDIIKTYFPQMPFDWRVLSKKWKDHGDQLTIPSEVSKLREELGELSSRPDVAAKLNEFKEALRNKFGDNVPVYRGSGNFESSFLNKPPDPSDKFTSVSASLVVAATFGAPLDQQGTEERTVEVTKYIINPEDVIAFTPSWECELVVRRSTLEQVPKPDLTGIKK